MNQRGITVRPEGGVRRIAASTPVRRRPEVQRTVAKPLNATARER